MAATYKDVTAMLAASGANVNAISVDFCAQPIVIDAHDGPAMGMLGNIDGPWGLDVWPQGYDIGMPVNYEAPASSWRWGSARVAAWALPLLRAHGLA